MHAAGQNGETLKEGIVISKRKLSGVFTKKYLVCVRFHETYDKQNKSNKVEYKVNSGRFNDIIIGAKVQAAFSQAMDGGFQPLGFFY